MEGLSDRDRFYGTEPVGLTHQKPADHSACDHAGAANSASGQDSTPTTVSTIPTEAFLAADGLPLGVALNVAANVAGR